MRALAHVLVAFTVPATLLGQPTLSTDNRDSAVVHAIEARMRIASGTLIKADAPPVANAALATDLIRFARGFRWRTPTQVETRGSAAQAPNAAHCESLQFADLRLRRGDKAIAVYLDGSRLPGGLDMVNRMVPITDVLAVEAYPDVLSAPSLWRTNDACAVVAFWTKRP
jgi:hypothetical protein